MGHRYSTEWIRVLLSAHFHHSNNNNNNNDNNNDNDHNFCEISFAEAKRVLLNSILTRNKPNLHSLSTHIIYICNYKTSFVHKTLSVGRHICFARETASCNNG